MKKEGREKISSWQLPSKCSWLYYKRPDNSHVRRFSRIWKLLHPTSAFSERVFSGKFPLHGWHSNGVDWCVGWSTRIWTVSRSRKWPWIRAKWRERLHVPIKTSWILSVRCQRSKVNSRLQGWYVSSVNRFKILQKILEPEIKLLREYFKPEMIKLFSLVLPNETTNTFCSSPDNRFAWLKHYVC